jgi:hypothetical protein
MTVRYGDQFPPVPTGSRKNRTPGTGELGDQFPPVPTLGELVVGTGSGNRSESATGSHRFPEFRPHGNRSATALPGPIGAFERYLWEASGGMWQLLDGQGGVSGVRPADGQPTHLQPAPPSAHAVPSVTSHTPDGRHVHGGAGSDHHRPE